MFCKQCGHEIKNGTFCPKCGANNKIVNSTGGETSGTGTVGGGFSGYSGGGTTSSAGDGFLDKIKEILHNLPFNPWLLLIPVGALVLIIVIIIVLVMVLGKGSNSAEGAAEQYYAALESGKAEDMLECVPDDFISDLLKEYDIEEEDLVDSLNDRLLEYKEDYYDDEICNIVVKNRDEEEMSRSELDDLRDDMEDSWDYIFYDFETDNISQSIVFELKVRYEDENGSSLDNFTYDEFITFKYSGDWYSINAMNYARSAAYDAS